MVELGRLNKKKRPIPRKEGQLADVSGTNLLFFDVRFKLIFKESLLTLTKFCIRLFTEIYMKK